MCFIGALLWVCERRDLFGLVAVCLMDICLICRFDCCLWLPDWLVFGCFGCSSRLR